MDSIEPATGRKGASTVPEYVTIRELSDRFSLSERTIRGLIIEHGLEHHQTRPRGKILVKLAIFQAYMESTKKRLNQDPVVAEILREACHFAKGGNR